MLAFFCNQFFAAWFLELGACGENPNPNGVNIINKALEMAQQFPKAIAVKVNCPNAYQLFVSLLAAEMLLTWKIWVDSEGNMVVTPPSADPALYVKRDKVGYVEREYFQLKPNCDDCKDALQQIRNLIDEIYQACISGYGFGGTNYSCPDVIGCGCGA